MEGGERGGEVEEEESIGWGTGGRRKKEKVSREGKLGR